ncbi:ABC transporter substrate-binding protein [Blautia liquoris]|mgnify:CR=1 FL=1|uniref:ABC transporter substrate-binding protein n=1 Tax=Blautia liquoris TaxID=2779518 RepID=A0A7M2RGK0_9FIRM|nr:ABC transporter substrate-binding protein [Blautia liquoris]QOV19463.1 ABC transporter substrate-binding protein [Blautia liquoris]
MKGKTLAIILSISLAGSMAGCGICNKKGNISSVVVTLPSFEEPEAGFDPVHGWGMGDNLHDPLIQSTLTTTTEDLKLKNDLAVDYTVSEDGLTWTVTIRDDVRFTDGKKLTANDVAFTYNECKDSGAPNDLMLLKRAEAIDDATVKFHMERPFNIWPYTMAQVGIVPKYAYGPDYGKNPIGSGRYKLKKWDRGKEAIFEANPDYYGDEIKMKNIHVKFLTEKKSYQAAENKDTDVAYISAGYAGRKLKGYQLKEVTAVDTLGMNLPVEELSLRRAVNVGIDRDKIVDKVLKGYGTPAYTICDQTPWYQEEAETVCDPEQAKEILEEAGWNIGDDQIRERDGKRAEFNLWFDSSDEIEEKLAKEISDQLLTLGMRVNPTAAKWTDVCKNAQTQPAVRGVGSYTPMELYKIYHSDKETGSSRYSSYANPSVDKYMDEALEAPSFETSYELWRKAQWDGDTGINGDLPWIWLCNMEHLYFVKDDLQTGDKDIHPHGQGWSLLNHVDQWQWMH